MRLTQQEITRMSTLPGVDRLAVENFLASLDTRDCTEFGALWNAWRDSRVYQWSMGTVLTIVQGIVKLYKKREAAA